MSKQIKIIAEKNNPNIESPKQFESQTSSVPTRKLGFWRVFGIILISLIFGGVGGVLADRIVIPFVEQKLAKQVNVVIPEKTEKVTVEENSATIESVKKVSPAVVSIVSTVNVQDIFGGTQTQKSGGTGFVLTSDGLILTNKHVAGDKNSTYSVLTSDGKDLQASILAIDPANDLAVLRVNAKNLPVVEIGDSSSLVPGQEVIAIGNALGEYQNTVTAGVVSAIGRAIVAGDTEGGSERIEGAIQTDAAINPGNSGGPLVNIRGQVVGINTAIDQGGQTIGFAIPINLIKPLDNFIKSAREGKIVRPLIGIRYIPITKELASINKLSVSEGALVYKDNNSPAVVLGSPADDAGIEEGDIITTINGKKIDKDHSLSYLIQQYRPGDEVELVILRDGKEMKVKLKLGEMQ
jgi:serine protease Do